MDDKEIIIEATVESIVYKNAENGYSVLRMKTAGGDSLVAVGCVPNPGVGESFSMTGVWSTHTTYGDQFRITGLERRLPATVGAILDYLSSGTIRGVGRATAQKIVDKFGESTFNIIEFDHERLTEIPGINPKKARSISESFRVQNGISRLMEFLLKTGFEPALALSIYSVYGAASLTVIQNNPYILAQPEFGVEFSMVDKLALSLGFPYDCPERVRAAVIYELSHNANAGHTFIPKEKLVSVTARLIDVDVNPVFDAMHKLLDSGQLVSEYVCGVNACYLSYLHEAETFVADKLCNMTACRPQVVFDYEDEVSRIEEENNIEYAPKQREAIIAAANSPVMILTGGPGTGKTTVVRGILSLFERMKLKTTLAAPTGRAAKRMGEFCGVEAKTIHRLLEMGFDDGNTGMPVFNRDRDNPLDTDVLIIDEVSMVDITLMRAVLDAISIKCKLILVGDADQLPSIGAGNVLKDLIASSAIKTVRLDEIFRQAAESSIVVGAHSVNRGAMPDFSRKNDMFFIRKNSYGELIDTVLELCTTRLPDKLGIPPSQIQVLTVSRIHEAGTVILNRRLQEALNPPDPSKPERGFGDKLFRVGDRVMQIRNNYDIEWYSVFGGESGTGVFNGDIGEITGIDFRSEIVTVCFDDKLVHYPFELLGELELAYAMTVHKAQGSEFKAVVFTALGGSRYLLHRSVLYTAITRARELLIIVGSPDTVKTMIDNSRERSRYSALRARIASGFREQLCIEGGIK
jgi:exodeoxyribonuclease V alpha subunit